MRDGLAAAVQIAAGLLIVSGVSKVRFPLGTAKALLAVGLPHGFALTRAIGLAEAIVGASALSLGGTGPYVLLACAYTAFAAFLSYALIRRIPLASCGCLGSSDRAPTWAHVAVNGVACGAACLAVAVDSPSLREAAVSLGLLAPTFISGLAASVGLLAFLLAHGLTRTSE